MKLRTVRFDPKQTTLPGTEARVPRPRMVSEESLRQAMRAYRKAQRPSFLSPSIERDARRLLSRAQKGHVVDTEQVKAKLAEREQEYRRVQEMLAGLEQQRATLITSARRLEGAMLTLREVLGPDAPPVPQDMRAPEPAPAQNDTEPAPPPENMQ